MCSKMDYSDTFWKIKTIYLNYQLIIYFENIKKNKSRLKFTEIFKMELSWK
jgi:hypothetical protein